MNSASLMFNNTEKNLPENTVQWTFDVSSRLENEIAPIIEVILDKEQEKDHTGLGEHTFNKDSIKLFEAAQELLQQNREMTPKIKTSISGKDITSITPLEMATILGGVESIKHVISHFQDMTVDYAALYLRPNLVRFLGSAYFESNILLGLWKPYKDMIFEDHSPIEVLKGLLAIIKSRTEKEDSEYKEIERMEDELNGLNSKSKENIEPEKDFLESLHKMMEKEGISGSLTSEEEELLKHPEKRKGDEPAA